MSKTKIKNRNRAHGKPNEKTLGALFDYKTDLFNLFLRISNDKTMFHTLKVIKLNELHNLMIKVTDRLIERGCITKNVL